MGCSGFKNMLRLSNLFELLPNADHQCTDTRVAQYWEKNWHYGICFEICTWWIKQQYWERMNHLEWLGWFGGVMQKTEIEHEIIFKKIAGKWLVCTIWNLSYDVVLQWQGQPKFECFSWHSDPALRSSCCALWRRFKWSNKFVVLPCISIQLKAMKSWPISLSWLFSSILTLQPAYLS